MKIALIQQRATRDKLSNIARGLANLDEAAQNGASLACFAELALEWFHPQHPATGDVHSLAESLDGPLVRAFREKARELGIVVVLNLFEREDSATFDSSPVIDADGTLLGVTRMVHITEYACFHEQGYYTPGDKGAPMFRTRAGNVGVAICYDRHLLEFAGESFVCAPDGTVITRAGRGTEEILYAEVDLASTATSHARQLFLKHRRPELYAQWLAR